MDSEKSKVVLIQCQVPEVEGWCDKKFSDFGGCAACYEAEVHLKKIAKEEAAKPGMVLHHVGHYDKLVPVDTAFFTLNPDEWNTLWGSNLKLKDGSDRTVASICKGRVSKYFKMAEVEKNA